VPEHYDVDIGVVSVRPRGKSIATLHSHPLHILDRGTPAPTLRRLVKEGLHLGSAKLELDRGTCRKCAKRVARRIVEVKDNAVPIHNIDRVFSPRCEVNDGESLKPVPFSSDREEVHGLIGLPRKYHADGSKHHEGYGRIPAPSARHELQHEQQDGGRKQHRQIPADAIKPKAISSGFSTHIIIHAGHVSWSIFRLN